MGEYIGRINVSKDAMLFIVNNVFNKGIKESTTKENILKLMPEIYGEANEKEIIKMLPYKSYKALEELIEYTKTSDNIKKFFYQSEHQNVRYLEESMIIIMRAKHNEYNYSLNPRVLEKLTKLFLEENRKIAERYGKIEELTVGMIYTYGVVEFNFLRTQLCKYMNEIISEDELKDIYFKRLNLNMFVNYYNIRWTNTNEIDSFVTYLDEEEIDIGDIAAKQKSRNLKYKNFTSQEILERKEYLWDKNTQELYRFIKTRNNSVWKFNF